MKIRAAAVTLRFLPRRLALAIISLLVASSLLGLFFGGFSAPQFKPGYRWNKQVLALTFHDVNIQGDSLEHAWFRVCNDLLIQGCLYWDIQTPGDSNTFHFNSRSAMGKQVLDAFLAAYPEFTYTEDQQTDVIWIHRKAVPYEQIYPQKIRIRHAAEQVPMGTGVVMPVKSLMGTMIGNDDYDVAIFVNRGVDLPAGTYRGRDILNMCLAQYPEVVFSTLPKANCLFWGMLNDTKRGQPPRAAAVTFWHRKMGDAGEGPPTLEEVGRALADASPEKRRAACLYLELSAGNYQTHTMLTNANRPEQAVWEMVEDAVSKPVLGINIPAYVNPLKEAITNELPGRNPGLALLAAMYLADRDKDVAWLDRLPAHQFTREEFETIRPEFLYLAQSSLAVRDKLIAKSFTAPGLDTQSLRQLGDSNLLTATWWSNVRRWIEKKRSK